MKNLLFKTLAVTVVMMFVCTSAFAAVLTTNVADNTLTAGEESTLLVVDEGTTLDQVASNTDKIFYVDQITAADGTATYTIDVTDAGNIDVYSEYTTMAAGESALFDAVEEEGGDDPITPPDEPATYTLGDVNNDGTIDGSDALAVIANFLSGTEFSFENGALAADVNNDGTIDGSDALAIIMNFLKGTPFAA